MLTRAKANMHISVKQKKKKNGANGPDPHRAAQHSAETARGRGARARTGAFKGDRRCADRRLRFLLPPRASSLSLRTADEHMAGAGFRSPRALAEQRGRPGRFAGSWVDAVARSQVLGMHGHGGGSTEFCEVTDDGVDVPATKHE